MNMPRILVAGIGNIFLGDDAFGVEVVQRLICRPQRPEVRAIDFGIRGVDLMYALLDGYESVILIDAVQRGEQPGTLYMIEPSQDKSGSAMSAGPIIDMHDLDPAKVLVAARSMGSDIQRVLLVGCEPSVADYDVVPLNLSEPVAAAVNEAIHMIESVIVELLAPKADSRFSHQDHSVDLRSLSSLIKEA